MANADTPRGLSPVRYRSGAPYNGAANLYYIPATDTDAAVYIGGLVKLTGSADADGVAAVTGNVATSNVVVGVVVGVEPSMGAGANGRDSTLYRANSTERYVWVADDPNLLFEVQDDASATLTAGAVGSVADLTGFTSGSTTTGLSAIEISASTATTGSSDADVQIVGLVSSPDNVIGDHANWLVRLRNHFADGATNGV
jgi:hypothetical protein